jgi:hypothetical protein
MTNTLLIGALYAALSASYFLPPNAHLVIPITYGMIAGAHIGHVAISIAKSYTTKKAAAKTRED